MSANVFELQGSISMDTSAFEKAIKDAANIGKQLAQSLAENTNQMKALQDSVEQAREELDSAEKAMQDTASAAETLGDETKSSAEATENMSDEVKELKARLDSMNDEYSESQKEVAALRAELEKTSKEAGENSDKTKELAEKLDKTEKEAAELKEQVDELEKKYNSAKKESDELKNKTEELGEAANSTGGKLSEFASFLGGGFITAAKAGAAAVAAAGAAVVGYTKSAFDEYSQFEQLQGGVETLFGDSASVIMENAEKAANTAGMSIDNYLDTVMGFSSSLIQATGRGEQTDIDELKKTLDEKYEAQKKYWDKAIKYADSSEKDMLRDQRDADLKSLKEANKTAIEEAEAANMFSVTTEESLAEAAKLSDVAIQDMSDNANKFGTNMASIQNAYQGFAKQNYTMLDNLKLGYGGTKEEMERLLSDAEKISGQDYSMGNLADMIEAIHVIQESLGIAGTTADEAAGTLEGSTKAMAAAWDNLKLAIASGDVEKIEENISALTTNIQTVISNAAPVIERILTGIGEAVQELAPIIAKELPELIGNLLPPMVQAVTGLISGLVSALPGILSALTDKSTVNTVLVAFQDLLSAVLAGLSNILGMAPDIIPDLLDQIGNALINSVGIIGDAIKEMLPKIGDLLRRSAPVLFSVISGLLTSIGDVLTQLVPELMPELVQLLSDLIESLAHSDLITTVALLAPEILNALLEGLLASQDMVLTVLPSILEAIFGALQTHVREHGDEFLDIMLKVVGNILLVLLKTILYTFAEIGIEIWQAIKGIVGFVDAAAEMLDEKFGGVITKVLDFFEDLGGKIYDWREERIQKFAEFVAEIINKIIDFKSKIGEKIGEIVGTITDKITGLVDKAKTWGTDLIQNFVGGITGKWDELKDTMSGAASLISDYIHFSEPEKGPLKDFHTFAPDMMELFAQGIRENAALVTDEMKALTEGISSDLMVESTPGIEAATSSAGGIIINNYLNIESPRISSDMDLEELSDKAIEMINEKLAQLNVFATRAYGGVQL